MTSFGDPAQAVPVRSVSFLRPEAWTPVRRATCDGPARRNRTIYQDRAGRFALIVEISAATTTLPFDAAVANERTRRNPDREGGLSGYQNLAVTNGPGSGATWEYLYSDDGAPRHAKDWFATVGATDLAVFLSTPAASWSDGEKLWAQVVASVQQGPLPPGFTGPQPPGAQPSPCVSTSPSSADSGPPSSRPPFTTG